MSATQLIKQKENFYPIFTTHPSTLKFWEKKIKMQVTSKGIKTVEKNGGIDNYILGLKNSKLNLETKKLKKAILKVKA